MLQLIAACAFLGLLIWAAGCDIARMEIPNRISVLLVVLYAPFALAVGAPFGAIGLHLAIGAAALLGGYVLFQLNVFGGGDAKILAAAMVWTGLGAAIPFLYWTALAGGLLSLTLIIARRTVSPSPAHPAFLSRLLNREIGAPYVVAIAAGGLAALPHLPILNLP
jgi:prepilin peptidase CpaA